MKKVSFLFVLLVALCLVFSALGKSSPASDPTILQYIDKVYQLFGENGQYAEWPPEKKLEWLHLLPNAPLDEGASEADIDSYFADKYGKGSVQTISVYYVLEDEWGDDFFWTLAEQAQVWQWTEKYFTNEQWDVEVSLLPTSEVISPNEAVQIAWDAVSQNEGLSSKLDDTPYLCRISYGIGRIYSADYPPYYSIYFGLPLSEPDDQRSPITVHYVCYVSQLGEIMDSSYFRATPSPEESKGAVLDFEPPSYYDTFGQWSLEEKADFSQKWKPYMAEYMKQYPNYRGFYYYETLYSYGLPSAEHIPQEQAEEIAREAAGGIGASKDYLSRAAAHCYFDVSDSDDPLWKVYLSTLFSANTAYQDAAGYFVIISASTGKVQDAYPYEPGMALELFR